VSKHAGYCDGICTMMECCKFQYCCSSVAGETLWTDRYSVYTLSEWLCMLMTAPCQWCTGVILNYQTCNIDCGFDVNSDGNEHSIFYLIQNRKLFAKS